MSRAALLAAMLAALLSSSPSARAQDPWGDVRALDAAGPVSVPVTAATATSAEAEGGARAPLAPSRLPPVPRPPPRPALLPVAQGVIPTATPPALAAAGPAASRPGAAVPLPPSRPPLPPPAGSAGFGAAPEAALASAVPVHLAPQSFAPPSSTPTFVAPEPGPADSLAGETFTLASFAQSFAPQSFEAGSVTPGVLAGALGSTLPASETVAADVAAPPPAAPASSPVAEASPAGPVRAEDAPEAPGLLGLPDLAVFSSAQAAEATPPRAAGEEAAPSADAAPAPPLYREVRELQRLQDGMAVGAPDALPVQNALIARIDEAFRAADPSVWSDPQNARALIVFALSGGGPGVLRVVLSKQASPAIDERLLRGTLAYLEGREPEALKQLGEIDARDLPDSLSGQVALAQAALWVRRDPARAAVLLGRARLMAPGTLVEEAALRREIFIAAQANELETFERLTSTYLARYRHSVYAGNFRQRFAAALTRMSFIDSAEEFHRVNDLLAPLEPESRREVALMIAQAALAQGKTTAAALSAELVLKGAVFGSLEADRATLYHAAATVASPGRLAEAQAELARLAGERFGREDVRLLEAAQAVAGSIGDAVNVPAPAPAPEGAAPDGRGGAEAAKDAPPPAILVTARAALDAADKSLREAPL